MMKRRTENAEAKPPVLDLVVAALITVTGAAAVWFLPTESTLRLVLTLPVLLFTPGYLLIQALVPPEADRPSRVVHGFLAIGASIAVVSLLALATAVVGDGFRPPIIVATVTAGCLTLAALANARRNAFAARRAPDAKPAAPPKEDLPAVAFEPGTVGSPIVDRPQPQPVIPAPVAEPMVAPVPPPPPEVVTAPPIEATAAPAPAEPRVSPAPAARVEEPRPAA